MYFHSEKGGILKILNFGSLNIDKVYAVDHFHEPGETIASSEYAENVGGKGLNQSVALKRAGAEVYHAGKVGNDGAILTDYLHKTGVDTSFISVGNVPTGHAIIEVDKNGQNRILLFGGANRDIDKSACDGVLSHFSEGDVIVLQNEISNVGYIMKKAHEKKMRIAFNPSPFEHGITEYPLEYVEWLLLNETEGYGISGETEPKRITESIIGRYPLCKVVLTLGEQGAVYAEKGVYITVPAFKVNAVDTTAAGDTFTGFFLKAAIDGLEPEAAMRLASKASSVTVSRSGAAETIPSFDELFITETENV